MSVHRLFIRLLIGCCWLLSLPLSAQLQPAIGPLQDYYHEHFTTRDGLPHNTVNAINQTQDGYLWFAGWEGVTRYNGRAFEWLSRDQLGGFADSGVIKMFRRADGSLVIGGMRGSLVFWRQGKTTGQVKLEGVISDIDEDSSGTLWVTTEGNGLFRVTVDGQVRRFGLSEGLPSLQLHQVEKSRDHKMWFATVKGLFWIDPALETPRFQPISRFRDIETFTIAESMNGSLLVGTAQGAFSIDQQQIKLLHPRLAEPSVSAFLQDKSGALWIGTQDQGIFRLSGDQLEQLSQQNGLPDNRVLSLFQDKDLNIWIGTNAGLYRMRNTAFRTLTTHNGLSDNYARTLLQTDDGTVWIGTSAGLNRYVDGQVLPWQPTKPIRIQSYRSLAQASDGDVWVGTFADGAIRLRNQLEVERVSRKEGLASDHVIAILPMADGRVWFGTNAGLSVLHEGRIQSFHMSDGLPGEFIGSLRQDNHGDIWISTNGGVAVYRHGKFERIDPAQLAPALHVFDVWFEPESSKVWFATDRGLARYDQATKQGYLVSQQQGFPVDKIFTVLPDNHGSLWMSSNHGIVRVSLGDAAAVIEGRKGQLTSAELYGVSDGMRDAQCNGGSMTGALRLPDGTFWFATAQGVARLHPKDLALFQTGAPQVVIEAVRVNGSPQQGPLLLPADFKRLEIDYTALSFQMPTRIRYKTKLEGFDNDWVERGAKLSAEYTNLAAGSYRFLVMAAYPGGDWSLQPAEVKLVVKPVWWQQPWLFGTVLVLLVFVAVALHRWHLRHLGRHVSQLRQQVRLQDSELQIQAEQLCLLEQDQSRLASLWVHPASKLNPDTGLPTSDRMLELVTAEFSRCKRANQPLSLILLEIEHWHELQAKLGKTNIDLLQQLVGQLLHHQLRGGDWVGHWLHHHFLLILPQTARSDAEDIAERLKIALQHFHEQQAFVPELSARCAVLAFDDSADLDTGLRLLESRLS